MRRSPQNFSSPPGDRTRIWWRSSTGARPVQTWDIEIGTAAGTRLQLSQGGTRLEVDGRLAVEEKPAEYEDIYRRFAELLREGRSEVDEAPFRLTADAFMIGRRIAVEPFEE
jgi:D-galactose 1-dehydrogenase